MDLSAHQNITKIHALKMIFKIINRYLHIHISCDIYIYIYRFHKRIPMDFGPPSKQAFGTSQSKTWIVDCFNFTMYALWCIVHLNFRCSQYPISQIWGRWGAFIILILIGNPGHKKSETAKKSWNFTQNLRCLMFYTKAWDIN